MSSQSSEIPGTAPVESQTSSSPAGASQSTKPKTPSAVLDLLKAQLDCAICCSIFHEPVTVIPCLHTFCGSCISSWVDKRSNCPSCRARITDTKHDYKAKELASIYLKERPDEQRGDEELTEMNRVYKPGTGIKLGNDYEDSGDEDDDDVEQDYFYDRQPVRPFWESCPWCLQPADPPNPLVEAHRPQGYTCPHPLPAPGTSDIARSRDTEGQLIVPDEVRQSHIVCSNCERAVPIGDNAGGSCTLCRKSCCNNVFGNCPAEPLAPMDTNWERLRLNYFGERENDILTAYLTENNTNLRAAFSAWVAENPARLPLPARPPMDIKSEDAIRDNMPACWHCRDVMVFQLTVQVWWKEEKMRKEVRDDREKCWYGYQCRTRTHNANHRERLNHMCDGVPPNQRRGQNSRPAPAATPPWHDNDHTAGDDVTW